MKREIEVYITVNDVEVAAEIDYRVTSWGAPASGPSYSSGGEPAEPPEFEIDKITVNLNNNEVEMNWDNLSEQDQDKIDQAIYEELDKGPDDYYDPD